MTSFQAAPFAGDAALRAITAEGQGDASDVVIVDGPTLKLHRRSFLRLTGLAGGGLMLAVGVSCSDRPDPARKPTGAGDTRSAPKPAEPLSPNAFLHISQAGIVIFASVPEIGQGVRTALPMIVAEELDAAWADVRVELAATDEARFGRQVAGGSRAVPSSWEGLRKAGASARAMLVQAAAARWQVSAQDCRTQDSHVLHASSGRRASYRDLASEAAKLPLPSPDSLVLKARKDYRILGQRIGGVDNLKVVTGQPLFGVDQLLPGMLYATYEKCPATGGRVLEANLEQIGALPGVKAAFTLEGNGNASELMPGVAIVASDTWSALSARKQLRISWDESKAAKDSWSSTRAQAMKLAAREGKHVVANKGDVDKALRRAAKTIKAQYAYGFVAHAQLEPQNCTAWYKEDGTLELWAPTQTPQAAVQAVARVLGIAEKHITLHPLRAGGGFGRRLINDPVCEAAAIAKQVRAPVKLQWTREDDMAHDFYRAGGFHALQAGIDDDGRLIAWRNHFITFSADGVNPVAGGNLTDQVDPGPLLQNFRMTRTMLPWHTPCGPWRAPGSNVFAFVLQSFLHEISVAAERDHLAFLLELMGEPRLLQESNPYSLHTGRAASVIKLAAEKAGWGRSMPKGRGLGLAFYFSHAGHFAEVAEVSVDDAKRLTIHRVTVAADVGPIVNRSAAENQIEGSVIDGVSSMLAQEITHEHGRAQQTNLHQYPLLRIQHAPDVAIHLIESDFPPTGLGEPALPPLAPAVCNAIFTAIGHRVRTLPIVKEGFSI
jgi:isoquinoline 1-oxidoreductase subunit beta